MASAARCGISTTWCARARGTDMARQLYIVGAGGFGREVCNWLLALPEAGRDWEIAGFLDDDPAALDGFDYAPGVVGSPRQWTPGAGEVFVCGIGRLDMKKAVCGRLLEQGADFMTLVHPTALVGRGVRLGPGVVICPRVTLTCDIEVGEMAIINCHSTVGHDVRIGAWSTISGNCDLTGCSSVGEGVFMGSGARVIPGKSVGDGAVVGAGAVVIRPVEAGDRVFGNPARSF